jgi:hypothetical protein
MFGEIGSHYTNPNFIPKCPNIHSEMWVSLTYLKLRCATWTNDIIKVDDNEVSNICRHHSHVTKFSKRYGQMNPFCHKSFDTVCSQGNDRQTVYGLVNFTHPVDATCNSHIQVNDSVSLVAVQIELVTT